MKVKIERGIEFKDKTRGGYEYRIYATDHAGSWPIIGAINEGEGWWEFAWNLQGNHSSPDSPSGYDLIIVKEE